MSSAMFNGPFTETLVARVVGMKKPVLANVRRGRLAKGMPPGAGFRGDWFLDAKAQVNYTRTGLSRVLSGLGISMEAFLKEAGAGIDFKARKGVNAQTTVAERGIEASAGASRPKAPGPTDSFFSGTVVKGLHAAEDPAAPGPVPARLPRRKGRW